jgi:hypothetical protein
MAEGIIGRTSTVTTGWELIHSADGKVRVPVVAHAALTALTPYKVTAGQTGRVTAALADDVSNYYVGVPEIAIASGAYGYVVVGGRMEDVITPSLGVTAGHAFSILDGAVADSGVVFTGLDGQFAVCTETSTASTTQNMNLVPEKIKGTT